MANRALRPAVLAATSMVVLAAVLTVGADTTDDDAYAAGAPATTTTPAPAAVSSGVPSTAPVARAAAAPAVTPTVTPNVAATVAAKVSPAGALFAGGSHFCSGSVVHSGSGDLVLTAAHCVDSGTGSGSRTGLTFAPGYHDGVAPLGMWTVTDVAVAPGWASGADPDLDFAFLTVSQSGKPASLESLTGANTLGTGTGFDHTITMTGYPDTADSPVVCSGRTTRSDTYQQRVACAGFSDGTSGGPWVTDVNPATGYGIVVGVIGGYQLGGDTPDVSYSAYFDDDIRTLYSTADR